MAAPPRKKNASSTETKTRASRSRNVASKSLPQEKTNTARWTFLTNHSHVLILLSRNPSIVLREVAIEVGITERAVQRIIGDLEEAGVIRKEKVGRQNHYLINADQPLRHPIESHKMISDLLELLSKNEVGNS
ncbi:ArsR family transcriptional regulator [Bremerella cremea]|uniref:MarR family transcriptional regulator n=1 Tax=Blastopirellula marina TaxID=124 RepID=A0A2S8F8I8_9BACT|nr:MULTISPECIES: winged helix-turn-helix domain-containing protein [Pirellulaceae]PQO28476.1 MarR family transcriptional regulator [Blastopirellula marina]RCS41845.1 ArsR family transcriptional regulator [Bremerella cremea]